MRTTAFPEEAMADHKMEGIEKYIARLSEELQARFDHFLFHE